MQDKHSKAHAEIARQIRLAKKRMFKANREGMDLARAGEVFWSDISDVIGEIAYFDRGGTNEELGRPAGSGTRFSDYIKSDIPAIPPDEPVTESEETEEEREKRRQESDERWQKRFELEEQIEQLAADSVDSQNEKQQLALLRLLHTIAQKDNAQDLAFNAEMAVFRASDLLIEQAIPALLSYDELPGGVQ